MKNFLITTVYLLAVVLLISSCLVAGFVVGERVGLQRGRDECATTIGILKNRIGILEHRYQEANNYIIQYFHK